jgi:hypothetical protein
MRIPENLQQPSGDSKEDGDGSNYKYERTSSFTSIGQDPVKNIAIRFSRDSFIRFVPGPRLLDIDECMLLFHLNRSLAEKVRSFRLYANEYELAEISSNGFSIRDSERKPELPLFFSAEELADPWVTLGPQNESTFHVRFPEQTPKRFFHAKEVAHSLR